MAVDRQVTRASLINKASVAATFAAETPEQIAKHRNIARRHQQLRKDRLRKDSACFPRFRVAEMRRLFVARHGEERLPDDDAGREYLRLVADHLAQIDPRLIRPWALQWMSEPLRLESTEGSERAREDESTGSRKLFYLKRSAAAVSTG